MRIAGGAALAEHAAVQSGARATWSAGFAGRGRVVVRPSGTEPVVRVTVEGENDDAVGAQLVQRARRRRTIGRLGRSGSPCLY